MIISGSNFFGLSVFYAQGKCHQLLNSLLEPALESLCTEGIIENFYFHLSHEQGSHINISMFTDSDGLELTARVDEAVGQFLKSVPSRNSKENFPKETIFRNFENNSFVWDIFPQHPVSTTNIPADKLAHIRYAVSKLICSQFRRKPLGKDALFSFSIQLQVLACWTLFANKNKAAEEVKVQVSRMLSMLPVKQQTLIEAASDYVIKQNMKELSGLSESVWSKQFEDLHHEDFREWIMVCKNLKSGLQSPAHTFIDICGIIMEHINLPSRQLNFISVSTTSKLLFN